MKNSDQHKFPVTAKAGLLFRPRFSFLSSFAVATPGKNPVVIKDIVIGEAFTSVEIRGDVIVVLTNGPLDTLMIKGKEKDVQWINAEVNDGRLSVNALRHGTSKIVIYVPAMTLQSMIVNGDATIRGGIINNRDLNIKLNGNITVDIRSRGKVKVEAESAYELELKS